MQSRKRPTNLTGAAGAALDRWKRSRVRFYQARQASTGRLQRAYCGAHSCVRPWPNNISTTNCPYCLTVRLRIPDDRIFCDDCGEFLGIWDDPLTDFEKPGGGDGVFHLEKGRIRRIDWAGCGWQDLPAIDVITEEGSEIIEGASALDAGWSQQKRRRSHQATLQFLWF